MHVRTVKMLIKPLLVHPVSSTHTLATSAAPRNGNIILACEALAS